MPLQLRLKMKRGGGPSASGRGGGIRNWLYIYYIYIKNHYCFFKVNFVGGCEEGDVEQIVHSSESVSSRGVPTGPHSTNSTEAELLAPPPTGGVELPARAPSDVCAFVEKIILIGCDEGGGPLIPVSSEIFSLASTSEAISSVDAKDNVSCVGSSV